MNGNHHKSLSLMPSYWKWESITSNAAVNAKFNACMIGLVKFNAS